MGDRMLNYHHPEPVAWQAVEAFTDRTVGYDHDIDAAASLLPGVGFVYLVSIIGTHTVRTVAGGRVI